MPIFVKCNQCEQKLQMADKLAGTQVHCPKCQALLDVPTADGPLGKVGAQSAPKTPVKQPAASDQWYVQLADNQRYGPVTRTELDQWFHEGRLTAEDQLLQEGWTSWKWAPEVYPDLKGQTGTSAPPPSSAKMPVGNTIPGVPMASPGSGAQPMRPPQGSPNFGNQGYGNQGFGNPGYGNPQPGMGNPYAAPASTAVPNYGMSMRPHRGVAVLMLAIFGWLTCPILSIIAWVMANEDLRLMNQGLMDPSGRGLTTAGKVIGIIQITLAGVGLLIFIGLFLLGLILAVAENGF